MFQTQEWRLQNYQKLTYSHTVGIENYYYHLNYAYCALSKVVRFFQFLSGKTVNIFSPSLTRELFPVPVMADVFFSYER